MNVVALAAGCLSLALLGIEEHAEILPSGKAKLPAYELLAKGPLRVRLRPGMDKPGMTQYCNVKGSAAHIAATNRLQVGDSWWLGTNYGDDEVLRYMRTCQPITFSQFLAPTYEKSIDKDPAFARKINFLVKNVKSDYTFEVGEWEDLLYRHWMEWDPSKDFGKTANELRSMDREKVHDVVVDTLREWKNRARGHLSLVNSYAMLSSIAEIGLDSIGIETSMTVPATQVKRAFARGAARQFGIPWYEQVSIWYGPAIPSGDDSPATVNNGTTVGPDAGHSLSHLARHWYTAWFSGAAYVMPEASQTVLFTIPRDATEFPKNVELSPYGLKARALFHLMKGKDIGVPYTPFAVLISRFAGRWTVWGKPWGYCEETVGDKMMERFFDQLFVGQSKGPGKEERYLCPSPYGDTFDVIVNDAERTAWDAYPVILAVGEIPWMSEDIHHLQSHVKKGGVLGLNEINANGWDRTWLGLADGSFDARGGAQVVVKSDGKPLLIRKKVGKGFVFVAARECEAAFPSELLRSLAKRYLPFSVEGEVQTLMNRTKDGWAVMLVNNAGISKPDITKPTVVDPSKTQHARIVMDGTKPEVKELLAGAAVKCAKLGSGAWAIEVDVPPGDMRLIACPCGRSLRVKDVPMLRQQSEAALPKRINTRLER